MGVSPDAASNTWYCAITLSVYVSTGFDHDLATEL
jgi:hypothetical protein